MSALIRRAAAGETIEVTEDGRPVVRLVLASPRGGLEQLTSEGKIDLPSDTGKLRDIEPLPPTPGVPLASEILAPRSLARAQ